MALLAACGGGAGEARAQGPSATLAEGSTGTTTTTQAEPITAGAPAPSDGRSAALRPAEEEAMAAYLESWETYAGAAESVDPSPLDAQYGGAALELRRAQVEQHRVDGTSGRIGVTHGIELVTAEGDNAAVVDRYLDRSQVRDRATGEVVSQATGAVVPLAANLHREHGLWKVVELTVVALPAP